MTAPSFVELIIDFRDPDIRAGQQEKLTQSLWRQMGGIPGVDADRVLDPDPPEDSKGASFLWGLLKAKISMDSLKNVFGFLGDRFGDKPIKIKAKFSDGREFELEAHSRVEFQTAEETIQRLSQLK